MNNTIPTPAGIPILDVHNPPSGVDAAVLMGGVLE